MNSDARAVYPSLRDKRVLITGGGSGIGESLVEAFARQGARVAFVDILDAESNALAERLGESRWKPWFERCDLKDIEATRAAIAKFEGELGGFDVLVNNAANDDRHTPHDVTPEYWDDRIAVNLRHMFFCAQAVAPGMKKAGGGVILNFGSISWHLALPNLVLYQTAKAGIEGMTRALARDLGEANIRVNCVVPGAVRTPRQMKLWHTPEEEAKIITQQCLKKRVDPIHVAAMVLFLASADAAMCTAHNYWVDGGYR
ncbi:MAG TPA: SDR family oxidoreductase [Gammaproteobacteria bacterium]|nr:SDR family oxidoreductase [Gammaproteobacteria bacterium]